MVFVAVAEPSKRSWVVADNHRVHALGNGDLPGVVLAHALGGTVLAKSGPLGLLTADRLPAEGSKNFAHRARIGGTLQHFSGRDSDTQSSAPRLRRNQA